MATASEKYIKGFSHWYYFRKHNPELLNSILQSKSDNDYLKELKDGAKVLKNDKISRRLQEIRLEKNIVSNLVY